MKKVVKPVTTDKEPDTRTGKGPVIKSYDKQRVKFLIARPDERAAFDKLLATVLADGGVPLTDDESAALARMKARADARPWRTAEEAA